MDTNGRAYIWYRNDALEPWTLSISDGTGRMIGTVTEHKNLPGSLCKRFRAHDGKNAEWFYTMQESQAWLEDRHAYALTSPATP